MRAIINRAILGSRYVLVVFYLGMTAGLALYALRFAIKLWNYAGKMLSATDEDYLLDLLYLLDSVLVASLVVTVVVSSWDSMVGRLDREADREEMHWVVKTDPGNLKIKLATAVVAISSIHLLQVFLKVESFDDRTITWSLAVHGLFLMGVVALALADRLEGVHEGKAAEPSTTRNGATREDAASDDLP